MDSHVQRLALKLKDHDLTEKLVSAGYHTPRAIKDAPDTALLAIHGVGRATVAMIRARIG